MLPSDLFYSLIYNVSIFSILGLIDWFWCRESTLRIHCIFQHFWFHRFDFVNSDVVLNSVDSVLSILMSNYDYDLPIQCQTRLWWLWLANSNCENFNLQQDLGALEKPTNQIWSKTNKKTIKREQFYTCNVNWNMLLFDFLACKYVSNKFVLHFKWFVRLGNPKMTVHVKIGLNPP